jgi:uncharacterized protein YgiM (DUF1202 family)
MIINPNFLLAMIIGGAITIILIPLVNQRITFFLRISSLVFLVAVASIHYKVELTAIYEMVNGEISEQDQKRVTTLLAGTYIVEAKKLNVRIAPNTKGQIVTSLSKGKEVYVYETKGTYARISEYFSGSGYGVSGSVAQWISADYLTPKKVSDLSKKSTK